MSFRILSLDGGGVRGVIGATILAEIEKQINQPLNKYFDLIAGTSTGAVLGAAIATGRSSNEIIELYKQQSSIIFPYRSRFSLARIPLILKYGKHRYYIKWHNCANKFSEHSEYILFQLNSVLF